MPRPGSPGSRGSILFGRLRVGSGGVRNVPTVRVNTRAGRLPAREPLLSESSSAFAQTLCHAGAGTDPVSCPAPPSHGPSAAGAGCRPAPGVAADKGGGARDAGMRRTERRLRRRRPGSADDAAAREDLARGGQAGGVLEPGPGLLVAVIPPAAAAAPPPGRRPPDVI